jgi:hypothetical protein
LDAVGTIVDPAAACLDKLAGRDHRGMADDGNRIALTAGLDPQYTKAVLRIVESYPVYQTGQNLRRTRHYCPRHRDMMNAESRRCYSSAAEIGAEGERLRQLEGTRARRVLGESAGAGSTKSNRRSSAIAGSASTSGASMAARSADRSRAKGGHPLIVDQAGAALQPFYLGINCG